MDFSKRIKRYRPRPRRLRLNRETLNTRNHNGRVETRAKYRVWLPPLYFALKMEKRDANRQGVEAKAAQRFTQKMEADVFVLLGVGPPVSGVRGFAVPFTFALFAS